MTIINIFRVIALVATKQGGVGIFYKESLALKVRHDLACGECIVTELSFVGKKIFFAVLYRNPCDKVDSPEFTKFLDKFENLHLQIKRENPYTVITVGDFNGQCQQWYPEGDSNKEGIDNYI